MTTYRLTVITPIAIGTVITPYIAADTATAAATRIDSADRQRPRGFKSRHIHTLQVTQTN
jgi:hypothetical protein